MCAVFHENPATRRRGAAHVGWISEGAPRPAGVANCWKSRCSGTLAPGFWPATRRAAVSAGVLMIGAERLHNGTTVGLTSLASSCRGTSLVVLHRCRWAYGWPEI